MKLAPVTNLDKKNKKTSKKFDDDVMSTNCDVSVNFPFYGQFGAIQKLDSECSHTINWDVSKKPTFITFLLFVTIYCL